MASAASARAARRFDRSFLYGLNRVTFFETSAGGGFQMACTHPEHSGSISAKCTTSHSNHLAGPEDKCLRRMMYWAFMGVQARTKDEHVSMWKQVVEECVAGTLPTQGQLKDGRMPADWSTLPARSCGAGASSSRGPERRPCDELGAAGSGAASSVLSPAAARGAAEPAPIDAAEHASPKAKAKPRKRARVTTT